VFEHLALGQIEDSCAAACAGIEIVNATIQDEESWNIPPYVTLSKDLLLMGRLAMSPETFKAKSVTIRERGSLFFTGKVPDPPAELFHKLNGREIVFFAGEGADEEIGRQSASEAVIRLHNGSTSVFGEFNFAPEPFVVGRVCGYEFPNCNDWRSKMERNSQIEDNDLGSGTRLKIEFRCAEDIVNYPQLNYPGNYEGASISGYTCLQAVMSLDGGDPTTPHWEAKSEEPEGIGAGTAVAITLGVILVIVAVGLVILVLLGKVVVAGFALDYSP
jgi:hypothetical protein